MNGIIKLWSFFCFFLNDLKDEFMLCAEFTAERWYVLGECYGVNIRSRSESSGGWADIESADMLCMDFVIKRCVEQMLVGHDWWHQVLWKKSIGPVDFCLFFILEMKENRKRKKTEIVPRKSPSVGRSVRHVQLPALVWLHCRPHQLRHWRWVRVISAHQAAGQSSKAERLQPHGSR